MATPVLAGRVVDAIVGGGPVSVVVGLAALIAGIAVLVLALVVYFLFDRLLGIHLPPGILRLAF